MNNEITLKDLLYKLQIAENVDVICTSKQFPSIHGNPEYVMALLNSRGDDKYLLEKNVEKITTKTIIEIIIE